MYYGQGDVSNKTSRWVTSDPVKTSRRSRNITKHKNSADNCFSYFPTDLSFGDNYVTCHGHIYTSSPCTCALSCTIMLRIICTGFTKIRGRFPLTSLRQAMSSPQSWAMVCPYLKILEMVYFQILSFFLDFFFHFFAFFFFGNSAFWATAHRCRPGSPRSR